MLPVRVLAVCDGGVSVREVAERLIVNPHFVVKVRQRRYGGATRDGSVAFEDTTEPAETEVARQPVELLDHCDRRPALPRRQRRHQAAGGSTRDEDVHLRVEARRYQILTRSLPYLCSRWSGSRKRSSSLSNSA